MAGSSDAAPKESSPDGQMHREAAVPPQQVRASCAWCRVPGPRPSAGTVCHWCPLGTQNGDLMLQCLPLLGDGTKNSPMGVIWSCKAISIQLLPFPLQLLGVIICYCSVGSAQLSVFAEHLSCL